MFFLLLILLLTSGYFLWIGCDSILSCFFASYYLLVSSLTLFKLPTMFYQEQEQGTSASSFNNYQQQDHNKQLNIPAASSLLHSMMMSSPASLLAHHHLNDENKSSFLSASRYKQNNIMNMPMARNSTGSAVAGDINRIKNIITSNQESDNQQVREPRNQQNYFSTQAGVEESSRFIADLHQREQAMIPGGKKSSTSSSLLGGVSLSSRLSLLSKSAKNDDLSSPPPPSQQNDDLSTSTSSNKNNADFTAAARARGTKERKSEK